MKKKALGKGLGALIPDDIGDLSGKDSPFTDVNAADIIPNRFQPRNIFKEEEIRSLAESIEENGLMQPVVVRKADDGGYEIISGERRFRAMKLLGYQKIPVIIKEVDSDRQMLAMALIENLQRENLNPIEEALGYKRLMDESRLTQQEVSKVVSKSRVHVTNTLRLLKLEQEIIEAIEENRISAGHGRALLSIGDKAARLSLLGRIEREGLSVRELEKISSQRSVKKRSGATSPREKSPEIAHFEECLQETFGTKVTISKSGSGGSIHIKYYGDEDLSRILEKLNIEVN